MISATDFEKLPIRVGLGQFNIPTATGELLLFIKQCGVDDVQLNRVEWSRQDLWEYEELASLRKMIEDYELRLMALENVPYSFYDKIMLGLDGRELQLENMCQTVRNMGQAGIPILGYHFMPTEVWRTSRTTPIRGGAKTTAFNLDVAISAKADPLPKRGNFISEREITEEEMWENYDWYMERILPVCEESNVRMALHPDDPPVNYPLGGVARIFRNFENFDRAMTKFNSPMHGLNFCHGCWSEMRAGAGVIDAIRHFGVQGKIFYVHLRDVQGRIDDFTECWIGEGNSDIIEVIRTLKDSGFRGFMIPDHVPVMNDDGWYKQRGRAYTVGYMKAMLDVLAS
ncbi:MAG: Mannonate dehydratase [Candidatus Moanabacter tarae]|uniref:mannonate dehydratase n=1 Tax=Candidatus Moanibacter tarae TaxID=2200854 RepID=A0A2Z4ADS9_9BACT|nr:MAG: Mannonate dehydratase [Candidatus Moanabacter tarae]|tara:strand:+ start:4512 stop:5537 length:1026 start_codon:yes stop_codon:yes gene_type:complete